MKQLFLHLIQKIQNNETNSYSYSKTGVTVYKEGCCEGYTLCSVIPFMLKGAEDDVLLIDMNGNKVKNWSVLPSPAKMLPDGSIITGTVSYDETWDVFNITQIDWNGNITWDFGGWDDYGTGRMMARQHHDFQREGNPVGYYAPTQDFVPFGKTLILAHKNFKSDFSREEITDDVIYEVDWNGSLTGFEWHASDHIDEMGFNLRERTGIWLNPGGPSEIYGCPAGDWLHLNSISLIGKNKWYDEDPITYSYFNPDNIIISSRNANFIVIISRDTGKIVYRLGPDYSTKTEEGKKLGKIIGPHNAHIIPEGLPGEGNILVFDNGGFSGYGLFGQPNVFRFYSRVIEFNPITLEIVQEYTHKSGFFPLPRHGNLRRFFSPVHSSAQRLPNGNTLITEGFNGRVFEITPDNKVVWEYITSSVSWDIYRAYRVPPEWIPGNPANYDFWG